MDFSIIVGFIRALWREIFARKLASLVTFAAASMTVLWFGSQWPSTFTASAVIFADSQNILSPIQGNDSGGHNHLRVIATMLNSPSLLGEVVTEELFPGKDMLPNQVSAKVAKIRKNLSLNAIAKGYIKVSFSASNSEEAYQTLNALIDKFLRINSRNREKQTRQAFAFVDNQVEQYKEQLVAAEERLKAFKSTNIDGRDSDVDASINSIRQKIENLKIAMEEDKTLESSLEKNLSKEEAYFARQFETNVYSKQLRDLENTLQALLLNYKEDYPDVISVREQIASVSSKIVDLNEGEFTPDASRQDEALADVVDNPLYQNLRTQLLNVQNGIRTKQRRLLSLQGLLEEEFERRKRVAARDADFAELTRDYNVTKRIYENMLEKKEKARFSMTLNVEGQGVTYRIHEPPSYPYEPIGMRFVHFVLAGPFAGLAAVLGLTIIFLILDPKIRHAHQLSHFEIPTLVTVPRVRSDREKSVYTWQTIFFGMGFILVMSGYLSISYLIKIGAI